MENPYTLKNIEREFTPAMISLQDTLIKLLYEKEFTDISVKLLCSNANVARSTFYTYYDNIAEIMAEIEDYYVSRLSTLNQNFIFKGRYRKEDLYFYRETFEYIDRHREVFYLILIHRPNYRFMEKWKQGIKHLFWERLFTKRAARNSDFILEIVASLALAAHSYVLKNPGRVHIEEMYPIMASSLQLIDYIE